MSIPPGVVHVVFGGALPGGEVWESGFWTMGNVPTSNATATELAALWIAQLKATDGSGGFYQSRIIAGATTSLNYVNVYCYVTGGSTADFIGNATTAAVVGTGTNACANQNALVVTLRTAHAGRRFRGRMYLPATGVTTSTATGQLPDAAILPVATGWGVCFSDWNASGDNGTICVVSRVGAGTATAVTEVTVDSIVDTQRRRRNKLIAAFAEAHAVT
jgi:hypothetical protein